MKKYYHIERVEWLKDWQAHKLIESLKKMLEKQSEVNHG
jgi:phage gp16-like protein